MERRRFFISCFALIFAVVAFPAAAQTQRERGPQLSSHSAESSRPAPAVPITSRVSRAPEIFLCETPMPSCRTTQDTFSLAQIRDLDVFTVWPAASGEHIQTVQFLLPDGNLYMSRKTRFSAAGRRQTAQLANAAKRQVSPEPPASSLVTDANKVHPNGIPSLLMKSRGDATVLTVLPVAGTFITQRNLSGIWRIRVFLDDQFQLEANFTLLSRSPKTAGASVAEEPEQ